MNIKLEKHAFEIGFLICGLSIFLTLVMFQTNVLLDFFITLNVLYFTKEVFNSELIVTKDSELLSQNQENDNSLFLFEKEDLPKNIQIALYQASSQEQQSSEQVLVDALQKAESLIEEKINLLKAKSTFKKIEIDKVRENIKEELSTTVVANIENQSIQKIEWDNWTPLQVNNQLLNQEIYCQKCSKMYKITEMDYEIQKMPSYYEVITVHAIESEKHTNNVHLTLDSYEILSKPILTVTNAKEIIA